MSAAAGPHRKEERRIKVVLSGAVKERYSESMGKRLVFPFLTSARVC